MSIGCSHSDSFPYEKGLRAYMNDFFQDDLHKIEDQTLVFIYLEYCRSCVRDALDYLESISVSNKNYKLYLIGDPNFYPENESILNRLKQKYEVHKDISSGHYSYITGIGEPLIIHVRKGSVENFIYINSESLKKGILLP